jgi:hypothetical protein
MTNLDVDDLLTKLPAGTNLALTDKSHSAVTCPPHDPSFLRPPLRIVEGGEEIWPPLILISAPGAVGKTAFAKYIASQKGYFLWDLGHLKLGDNSFVGTVAQCFGAANLQSILKSLGAASAGFVFDALDEAELLSGWQRLESFLERSEKMSRRP